MATTFVRHNIWSLDQIDHWHPVIDAYARAVTVLQQRSQLDEDDPTG